MKAKLLSLVGFSLQQHSLKTEVLSGLTTFTTMSYILALMPIMFAPIAAQGYPVESLLTATTLATIVGTLLMAFLAKRPFGQAPGLAINLFFVETVCLSLGYTWQFALTAVFLEGVLFVLLCISNLRQIIFEMIPASLKYAIAAGIGFFIAMIGFKNSGLLAEGTIFNHIHTLVSAPSLLFLLVSRLFPTTCSACLPRLPHSSASSHGKTCSPQTSGFVCSPCCSSTSLTRWVLLWV